MSIDTKEMPQTVWQENSTKMLGYHVLYISTTKYHNYLLIQLESRLQTERRKNKNNNNTDWGGVRRRIYPIRTEPSVNDSRIVFSANLVFQKNLNKKAFD